MMMTMMRYPASAAQKAQAHEVLADMPEFGALVSGKDAEMDSKARNDQPNCMPIQGFAGPVVSSACPALQEAQAREALAEAAEAGADPGEGEGDAEAESEPENEMEAERAANISRNNRALADFGLTPNALPRALAPNRGAWPAHAAPFATMCAQADSQRD